MPDPLVNDEFSDFDARSRRTGAESRSETGVSYQPPLKDSIYQDEMSPDRQLPEGGSAQLNRTARQLGNTLGRVVSQARRAPHGLHLVRDRAQEIGEQAAEQISSSASSLAGNAQQRIRGLGDAAREVTDRAQHRAAEWMDFAEERGRVLLDKADDVASYISRRTGKLRQEIDERTLALRNQARIRVYEARLRARHTIREHPLETLGCMAGAAFILGITLRIVRSRNANRY